MVKVSLSTILTIRIPSRQIIANYRSCKKKSKCVFQRKWNNNCTVETLIKYEGGGGKVDRGSDAESQFRGGRWEVGQSTVTGVKVFDVVSLQILVLKFVSLFVFVCVCVSECVFGCLIM